MNKFIDAYKLIAEIEKRQEERQDRRDSASWENEYWPEGEFCTRDDEDDAILSIITSLQQEQPKMDLKKEIDDELDRNWHGYYIEYRRFAESAKHFYEFGINARKEK